MSEIILPYMLPKEEQTHITENYVSSPPALIVVDSSNTVWTLAATPNLARSPRGEYAFDVLMNGLKTGEVASRIERRGGKIRIFTSSGWRTWNGRAFI